MMDIDKVRSLSVTQKASELSVKENLEKYLHKYVAIEVERREADPS